MQCPYSNTHVCVQHISQNLNHFCGVVIGKETKVLRIFERCMPISYSSFRSTLLCLMVIHYQRKMLRIESAPGKQVQLSK